MKLSIVASIIAIASTAVAVPASTGSTHLENFAFAKGVKTAADDGSYRVCFYFSPEGSLEDFYYTFNGPWGSGSGHATGDGTICVPSSNRAGGAMFIGDEANPGPGSTKLECNFPDSGTATCDVSLVDGYSVAVQCQTENSPDFGGLSLLGQGQTCPDQQGPNCINTEGYSASQSDVAAFFQTGVKNGNNYCIWHDCAQLYSFPITNSVSCSVTL